MKYRLQPKWLLILLISICFCVYLAILVIGSNGLRGIEPQDTKYASIEHTAQRAMSQFCTGIQVTPQGTWLVGNHETNDPPIEQPKTSIDLSTLVQSKDQNTNLALLGLTKDKYLTYISRLDKNGQFQEVARLPAIGCLMPSPDGSRILLFTDIRPPDKNGVLQPMAVFRSDDQGKHWQWQQQELFSKDNGSMPHPTFYANAAMWVWKDPPVTLSETDLETEKTDGLYFSPDLGHSVEKVSTATSLLVSHNALRDQVPTDADWGNQNPYGEINAYVTQWHDNQAVLWISQSFFYDSAESNLPSNTISVTSQVKLQYVDNHWKVGAIKRINGLTIDKLISNAQGRFIAIQTYDNQIQQQVAELRHDDLSWTIHGKLPQPFWLFNDHTSIRDLWMNKDMLLISTMSSHEIPRLFRPSTWFTDKITGSVSVDGLYYSKDWGETWQQLAIDAPSGVLGIDTKSNQIFWSNKPWYDNPDLNIRAHTLQ